MATMDVVLFVLWCTFLVPSLKNTTPILREIFMIQCFTGLVDLLVALSLSLLAQSCFRKPYSQEGKGIRNCSVCMGIRWQLTFDFIQLMDRNFTILQCRQYPPNFKDVAGLEDAPANPIYPAKITDKCMEYTKPSYILQIWWIWSST